MTPGRTFATLACLKFIDENYGDGTFDDILTIRNFVARQLNPHDDQMHIIFGYWHNLETLKGLIVKIHYSPYALGLDLMDYALAHEGMREWI